jgi:hypothetical protein
MVRLILAIATFALTALSVAPSYASVLWKGTFEDGSIDHWTKAEMVNADRLQVVADPMDAGRKVLRVRVHQGDDPINASGNRNELLYNGDLPQNEERWYRWQTMWPADYQSPDTWQLFTQFHHIDGGGSPPLEFYAQGEEIRLRASGTGIWTHALERGTWHDFVLHVFWSADATKGYAELWYDGKQVLTRTPAATLFAGQSAYLKQGLYRNETINFDQTIYQTGATIGTTMNDVWPPDPPKASSSSNAVTTVSGTTGGTTLPPLSAKQVENFKAKTGCSTLSFVGWPLLAMAVAAVLNARRRKTAPVTVPIRD